MADRLTGKQKLFVDHYIICLNATEAARRAGYAGDDVTLSAVGSENLRKPQILNAIDERLNTYAMSANEVLTHLTDIARGDIGDALNQFGAIDPLEAKKRGKSHLIKRFKTKFIATTDKGGSDTEISETEIEMYDRLKALDLLAKYHDLVNRIKVTSWQDEIILLLREGKITPQMVVQEIGYDFAQELFKSAGIPLLSSGES